MSPDRERVLVCSRDARVQNALHEPDVVLRAAELLERDEHRVVVLDAHSDPQTVAYLRSLGGARRRDLTVVLVCDDARTGDRERAWRESVDLVVHTGDLERLDSLLQEQVWEKGRFYERFRGLASAQGEG